jgi:hypothetical protein
LKRFPYSLSPTANKQFSRNSVLQCLERDKESKERTILGSLQRAKDKETGAKLSFEELVTNANIILFVYFEDVI